MGRGQSFNANGASLLFGTRNKSNADVLVKTQQQVTSALREGDFYKALTVLLSDDRFRGPRFLESTQEIVDSLFNQKTPYNRNLRNHLLMKHSKLQDFVTKHLVEDTFRLDPKHSYGDFIPFLLGSFLKEQLSGTDSFDPEIVPMIHRIEGNEKIIPRIFEALSQPDVSAKHLNGFAEFFAKQHVQGFSEKSPGTLERYKRMADAFMLEPSESFEKDVTNTLKSTIKEDLTRMEPDDVAYSRILKSCFDTGDRVIKDDIAWKLVVMMNENPVEAWTHLTLPLFGTYDSEKLEKLPVLRDGQIQSFIYSIKSIDYKRNPFDYNNLSVLVRDLNSV